MIALALSNFTVTCLVLGLLASALSLARQPRPWTRDVVCEALLAYFLLFSIGVSFLYNFVMHVFFGEMVAAFIGWKNSPFQAEVGFASLGFSAIGFLAFRGDFSMRLAAVLGPTMFLWGAAAGHVRQMIVAEDFAPGNAGTIFYTDIGVPLLGLLLLWLTHSTSPRTSLHPVEARFEPGSPQCL